MAQSGIFFAGKQILIPGAYAQYHSLAAAPINVAATNVVAIIAKSVGGKPFVPTGIGNGDMDRVKLLYRGGPMVDAAEMAVYPFGRDVEDNPNPGAADLILVRPTDATQGKLETFNTNAVPVKVGAFVSRDYGAYVDGHQPAIVSGSGAGTVRVRIQNAILGVLEDSGDLGNILAITYTGAGEAALTIDEAGFHVTVTFAEPTDADGSGSFSVSFDNAEVPSIASLARYIAAQPKFRASIMGSPEMHPRMLDRVSGVAIAEGTSFTPIKGTVGAVYDWVNRNSALCQFELEGDGVFTHPIGQFGFTNLSGGTDGVESATTWKRALDALRDQPAYHIVPIIETDDANLEAEIRDLVISHIFAMRDIKIRKRRYLWLGHKRGLITVDPLTGDLDLSGIETILGAMNMSAASFCTPGVNRTIDGKKKSLSAYYNAAAAAGIKAGSPPQRPLTMRKVRVDDLEHYFDPDTEERLIKIGASYLVNRDGVVEYGIGQTTWLQDTDPVKSEPSLIHIGDTLSATCERELKAKFGGEPFRGEAHLEEFKSKFRDILVEAQAAGLIVDGNDPQSGAFVPAFRNIRVAFGGRRWSARAVVTASEPGNYITIEIGFAGAGGSSGI